MNSSALFPWEVAERATLRHVKYYEDLERFGWPAGWVQDPDRRIWVGGDMCISDRAVRLLPRRPQIGGQAE